MTGSADPAGRGQTGSDTASAQLARVATLLELRRPEQALDELTRLPADVAGTRPAFQLRAAILTALGRWDEVVVVTRQGLAETGPDPTLLGRLGLALRHRGEYPAAERVLLDGLAIAPNGTWLLCQYADLCCAFGQTEKATKLVERAAALDPEAPAVYATRFQIAYARGDDRATERIAREFLGRYPEEPAALAMHGAAAVGRGRMAVAARSFGQAVARDPGDADYADAAWETRVHAHPLLIGLRPLHRFGVFRTWLVAFGTVLLLSAVGLRPLAGVLGLGWLGYCVYSWVAPPLVRRLVRRRWRA